MRNDALTPTSGERRLRLMTHPAVQKLEGLFPRLYGPNADEKNRAAV